MSRFWNSLDSRNVLNNDEEKEGIFISEKPFEFTYLNHQIEGENFSFDCNCILGKHESCEKQEEQIELRHK